jgi:hypothetical protein
MLVEKFTAEDRRLVISELEKIQQSKLVPVKTSKKLFTDDKGMIYFIFGGKNDWHGIRPSAMIELSNYNHEGAFVVVKKYKSKMDLCVGSLITFLTNTEKLLNTQKGDFQFHTVLTEDGMYLKEIPDLYLNKVGEIHLAGYKKDISRLENIAKIINIEVDVEKAKLTHSDLQAKLVLIGSYLGFRTYVAEPDKGRSTIFGKTLGELCSEQKIPEGSIPALSIGTIKYVDVIWFDEEGYPTHAFEVEHSTDITKGLLRLYQIHKLKIKMFIVSEQKDKFEKEVRKNPFSKIKEEFLLKNYDELDEFFESVKKFTKIQQKFLSKI